MMIKMSIVTMANMMTSMITRNAIIGELYRRFNHGQEQQNLEHQHATALYLWGAVSFVWRGILSASAASDGVNDQI